MNREISPLKQADDAVLVDSSEMGIDDVVNAILNVYKEKGFTSHDVVAKLRGILKTKKIGHTGTLDPEAEGVLPICIGNATKLCDLIMEKRKTYEAELVLGLKTDTQDMTGEIIEKYSDKLNPIIEPDLSKIDLKEYSIFFFKSASKIMAFGKPFINKHIFLCDYKFNSDISPDGVIFPNVYISRQVLQYNSRLGFVNTYNKNENIHLEY